MESHYKRAHGRKNDQLRTIKISHNLFGYSASSVLLEQGNTKVLCAVTLSPGVPSFLKGSRTGWLTAEYAMLPTAAQNRLARESSQAKRNDRSVEISRLIGRSLRCILNLNLLGERTIFIDCDVLQADGSTRTAAITGAYIALKIAQAKWLDSGLIAQEILTDELASVSAGFGVHGALLDLDYEEDSTIHADYNFILTRSEKIIEIQGTAEKNALSWSDFEILKTLAIHGVKNIFTIIDESFEKNKIINSSKKHVLASSEHVPLFSLKNRLANNSQ